MFTSLEWKGIQYLFTSLPVNMSSRLWSKCSEIKLFTCIQCSYFVILAILLCVCRLNQVSWHIINKPTVCFLWWSDIHVLTTLTFCSFSTLIFFSFLPSVYPSSLSTSFSLPSSFPCFLLPSTLPAQLPVFTLFLVLIFVTFEI